MEPQERTFAVSGGCVTLLTPQPESLLAFYREVLGLELRFRGPRFSELSTRDGFRVALLRCDDPSPPPAGAALGFAVPDWEIARASLGAAGLLDREEEDEVSGVALLWFRDPEGRPLYLWRLL